MANDGSSGADMSLDSLLQCMQSHDMLNRWDVVVAYQEDAFNLLLQSSHQKIINQLANEKKPDIFQNIHLDATEDNPFRLQPSEKVPKTSFTFSIGTPSLKLIDDRCTISLTFPIKGTSKDSTGAIENYGGDGDLFFRSTKEIKLITCSLDQNPSIKPEKESNAPSDAAKDTARPPKIDIGGENQQVAVTLDLSHSRNSEIFVLQKTTEGGKDIFKELPAPLDSTVLTRLESYLQRAGFRYHLGGVSNRVVPNQSASLKPTNFVITSVKSSQRSAIIFWMNVDTSKQIGLEDKSDFNLSFQKADSHDRFSPVPTVDGVNACVYISHKTMTDMYIWPAFQNQGFRDPEVDDVAEKNGGICFQITPPDNYIRISRWASGNQRYDEFGFNTNSQKASFQITTGKGSGDVKYEARTKFYQDADPWDETFNTRSNEASMTFHASASGPWQMDDEKIHLQMQYQPTYDFTLDQSPLGWWSAWSGQDGAPDELKRLVVSTPSVNLDLASLNYFLTTNLTFPGRHIFHSQGGVEKGFFIPHDVLLLGRISDS